MGLLSTPEVKTVGSRSGSRSRGSPQNQKLEEGIAKIEENSPKLLENQNIFSDFSKTGRTSSRGLQSGPGLFLLSRTTLYI
jgi:hypothetical protein